MKMSDQNFLYIRNLVSNFGHSSILEEGKSQILLLTLIQFYLTHKFVLWFVSTSRKDIVDSLRPDLRIVWNRKGLEKRSDLWLKRNHKASSLTFSRTYFPKNHSLRWMIYQDSIHDQISSFVLGWSIRVAHCWSVPSSKKEARVSLKISEAEDESLGTCEGASESRIRYWIDLN